LHCADSAQVPHWKMVAERAAARVPKTEFAIFASGYAPFAIGAERGAGDGALVLSAQKSTAASGFSV